MSILLRDYTPEDCAPMAALFYETVHTVNCADYTPQQLAVWATGTVDLEAWNQSFLAHDTVLAQCGDTVLGFGDMDDLGYFDRLYVHRAHQRRGVASAIAARLEHNAKHRDICRVTTHASITAMPFFLQRGYRVVQEQFVTRQGIVLQNFSMERWL